MIYCIDTVYGRLFYQIPSLEGESYICEVPIPLSIYIAALFVDHHPNNWHSLEDMTTLHVCKHHHPSKR